MKRKAFERMLAEVTGRPAGCTCGGRGRPCYACSTAGETVDTDRDDWMFDQSKRWGLDATDRENGSRGDV